ncbi:MAG TPA: hypothetical protein VF086_13330 [Propionibacteriaceae bacterium]
MTLHNDDLVAAEGKAREALDVARESNDADLEVCARSELGAVLVELGRTREGTTLLDAAMAGALGGEVQNLDAVVLASCRTITSCSLAVDIKRATQWIRAATRFNDQCWPGPAASGAARHGASCPVSGVCAWHAGGRVRGSIKSPRTTVAPSST